MSDYAHASCPRKMRKEAKYRCLSLAAGLYQAGGDLSIFLTVRLVGRLAVSQCDRSVMRQEGTMG